MSFRANRYRRSALRIESRDALTAIGTPAALGHMTSVLSVIHIKISSKGVCHVGSVTENPATNSNRSPRHDHHSEGQGRDGSGRHRRPAGCLCFAVGGGRQARRRSERRAAKRKPRSVRPLAATERERQPTARSRPASRRLPGEASRVDFASCRSQSVAAACSVALAARSAAATSRLARWRAGNAVAVGSMCAVDAGAAGRTVRARQPAGDVGRVSADRRNRRSGRAGGRTTRAPIRHERIGRRPLPDASSRVRRAAVFEWCAPSRLLPRGVVAQVRREPALDFGHAHSLALRHRLRTWSRVMRSTAK